MMTVAEIRRENLDGLIKQHESVANLNDRLGWPRTDPRLSRIRNANMRGDRGKPFQMGDSMAREIEAALGLELGWMDNRHVAVAAGDVALRADEDRADYSLPASSTLRPPTAGTDYRTVAYSLAAALDASNQKVDIRRFLAMVDAAFRNLKGH